MTRATRIGPLGRQAEVEARRFDIDPTGETGRMLRALAWFADRGVASPGVTSLQRRARCHRLTAVLKLEKLVRLGLLDVEIPGDPDRGLRSTFRLTFAPKPAATAASTEEANMATKPKGAETPAPTAAPAARPALIDDRRLPPFARHGGWLPDAFEEVDWAPLEEIRDRHTEALIDLEGARSTGDLEAERAGLLALADLAEAAVRTIAQGERVFLAAYDVAAAGLMPKTKPRYSGAEAVNLQLAGGGADDPVGKETENKIQAELAESKPRREALDRDQSRVRKLLGLIQRNVQPEGGMAIPRLVYQASQLRRELPSAPIAPPAPNLDERVAALEAAAR